MKFSAFINTRLRKRSLRL